MKKTITVQGLSVQIEAIREGDFVSLTDIAKQQNQTEPRFLILSWLKNQNTLEFLETWETVHNKAFKREQMVTFRLEATANRNVVSIKKLIDATNMIGLTAKSGRYGGTWAHADIALNFMYWLSPSFQVYFVKEFQRLKKEEFSRQNLQWHITKITDNIDEVRHLLDTIPGQLPELYQTRKEEEQQQEEE